MGKIADAAKAWTKAQATRAAKGAGKGIGKGIKKSGAGLGKGTKWVASTAWKKFLEPKWADVQESREEARKLKSAAEGWAKGVKEGQTWKFGGHHVYFQLEGRKVLSTAMHSTPPGLTPLQVFARYFDPERPDNTEPKKA
ncbi:hypothetical protein BIV57_11885 [Mangrovactinospora gilvigrisea]|uniref:Uncharacterized protein n=1 Tax=Mangrovactinospora gilvigrisea TaxID=1428644 RepID=A0A1J7C6W7_9ACTN|nr:hypothetical protein [Mangrovactinospora gilvigrisea]OIV37276.1 hypothetical protein BIV57_11885 [Mangrovactinospora gilvigrisea]